MCGYIFFLLLFLGSLSWSEKTLGVISVLLNSPKLVSWPNILSSWKLFCVDLERMFILLFSGRMFCTRLLSPSALMCHGRCFLVLFLPGGPVHCCQWVFKSQLRLSHSRPLPHPVNICFVLRCSSAHGVNVHSAIHPLVGLISASYVTLFLDSCYSLCF